MTNAELTKDGKYLTVRLSMTFFKSTRRKRIVAPDGASPWGSEICGDEQCLGNCRSQSAPMEMHDGKWRIRNAKRTRQSRTYKFLVRLQDTSAELAIAALDRNHFGRATATVTGIAAFAETVALALAGARSNLHAIVF